MPLKRPRHHTNQDSLWVVNITKRNISVPDLGCHIPAMRNVDLLDKRNYLCTRQQVETSLATGDLSKRRDAIVVRAVPPTAVVAEWIPQDRAAIYPIRQRPATPIEKVHYDELELSDEQFAAEQSDSAQSDHEGKWSKPKGG